MSRGRSSGSSKAATDNEQVMTQVWHGFIDTLRLLPTIPPSIASTKSSDEDRQKELRLVQNEKKTLDDALDKISLVISLRNGEQVDTTGISVPTVQVSTPSSTGVGSTGGGGVKRKRKGSISASPAPVLPSSADSALTPFPSPLPRGGTPSNRELTGKQRKEMYWDQLPLQSGRKVAFKVPSTKSSKSGGASGSGSGPGGGGGPIGGGEDDEDNWILATIKRCIHQDRMRYEVQDDDDHNNTFNTTLRSIIPLPDPKSSPNLSSHPSNLEDFPRGSTVLGLYPDTTSFYRATVVSAPIPGTGMGLGVKNGNGRLDPGAKKGMYRLAFVDDGDNVHEVNKDYVIIFPH